MPDVALYLLEAAHPLMANTASSRRLASAFRKISDDEVGRLNKELDARGVQIDQSTGNVRIACSAGHMPRSSDDNWFGLVRMRLRGDGG